nr:MAG: structural polyprotein [Cripavirus sp.]
MYQRKLERFLGLRADLEVRVQVNAQPFHAGRLMLSWTPFLKQLGPEREYYYAHPATDFLTCVSGNPRVEIDLSTTTEATMNIPFVSPFLYYNLVTGAGDIGTFQLIVYSPLVDLVSGGNIDYTIWVRMVNVRAEFPTGMPMSIAQVGREGTTQVKQGFVTRQSEAYSTILEPITKIPIIGSMASLAKTGVDALHSVASTFGWSKPLNPSDLQVFKNAPARFMCNADGSDMATNLGLTAQNELEQLSSLFRTDVDEMSLSYVARTPNYVGRFNWTKGQAPGTILYSRSVSPVSWFSTVGVTGVIIPHMAFVASHFVMWRGGINLRLKFVKTKFHSGRIRIYYTPGQFSSTHPTNFSVDSNYSTVVDIRSDTDIEFNIPYVAIVPWLHVQESFWNGNPAQTQSSGYVTIEVLNELVSTSTVSDTIEVLVEVSGAEDIEFAVPFTPYLSPRAKPNSSSLLKKIKSVAQVGTEEGDKPLEIAREEISTFAEVDNQPTTTTFNVSMLTTGEKITSFRQLVKRFGIVRPIDTIDYYQFTTPFWLNSARFTGSALEGIGITDHVSLISTLYAFYRGSMRYKICPLNVTYPLLVQLEPTILYTGQQIVEPEAIYRRAYASGAEVYMPSVEGVYEISVPYYSAYPVTLTTLNAAQSDVLDARNGFNKVLASFQGTTRVDSFVYRAAADDFSFGFLLGPPVLNHRSA